MYVCASESESANGREKKNEWEILFISSTSLPTDPGEICVEAVFELTDPVIHHAAASIFELEKGEEVMAHRCTYGRTDKGQLPCCPRERRK